MNTSLRRVVLPVLAGVMLLGWSSVASAGGLHSRRPMVTAPREAPARYVAPRNLVPVASHQSTSTAPTVTHASSSKALPTGQTAASKPSGIPR